MTASIENVETFDVGRHELKIDRVRTSNGAQVFRVKYTLQRPDGGLAIGYYDGDELTLARALAQYARKELESAREPELYERASLLKARDNTLATAERQVFRGVGTGVILGDTPADERPGFTAPGVLGDAIVLKRPPNLPTSAN